MQPEKYVGVDWFSKEESNYFKAYADRDDIRRRLLTYWQTGQDDETALRRIVEHDFGGPFDLVIDDASHMYGLTKRTFEILFPYLRPGGYYIIEDWAWVHWKDFEPVSKPWLTNSGVTPFIYELIDTVGTSAALISEVVVNNGFTAILKARSADSVPRENFRLENYIYRRSGFERWPPADENRALATGDPAWSEPLQRIEAKLDRLLDSRL